ncbi:hypothetical protein Aph01nite_46840 [Acrocarpospora phusangensis]|uniref:THIF-type NAD/FAD binding fold domain-containing protein n=1 Tax=Acrocarpospora phusangensis TaxID=1070424 RepID=A0A919ULW0_9ACTN|nr:ThiF family adenylyltransferase [Acrocarpospora phusangensis]GIH26374.1 hypothetical protein Aph01nite_46840 [Acrocarpospora phusangensis]
MTDPAVRIADYVLDRVAATLGATAPEQGGALLGVPGADVVTLFLHDESAEVTSVLYHNSDRLIEEIGRVERGTAARFKGIAHSHPGGMATPSGQDRAEFARSLALNPALTRYLAPIVTHDADTPLEGHELALDGCRISFFGATRTESGPRVAPVRPVVLPIRRSLTRAGFTGEGDPALVTVDGTPMLGVTGEIEGLGPVAVLFGADYPAAAPLVVAGGVGPVPLRWDLSVPAADRLARAVRRPPARVPLQARSAGLLSPVLAERRVLVAGAGSVGSYLAEVLARAGVGAFTLVDPETVAAENLGRSAYRVADVGAPKTEALARLVRAINPACRVDGRTAALHELPAGELAALVAEADLVVAATDDNAAQARLDHLAYWYGKPAVFPALYRGAEGGEVVMVADGLPCWGCCAGSVRAATAREDSPHRRTDYGTGRLVAEPGLLTDIHHVCSVAGKLALGLLHPESEDVAARRFADQVRERGASYAVFANRPGYWIFPALLGDAFGQHAYQSVWLVPSRDADCPVCGDPAGRTDPAAHPVAFAATDLLAAYESAGPGPG